MFDCILQLYSNNNFFCTLFPFFSSFDNSLYWLQAISKVQVFSYFITLFHFFFATILIIAITILCLFFFFSHPFCQDLISGVLLFIIIIVTTQLITPVMGISWPCILGKECFDMLKCIGFGDLVRLFSRVSQSDRVYLGWYVWDLVWRLFTMEASWRSVKAQ